MPQITREQLATLDPYLVGQADELGEIGMYCPRHDDTNASASVNVNRGVWNCQAACGGGAIRQLIEGQPEWIPVEGRITVRKRHTRPATRVQELPSEQQVRAWQTNLAHNAEARSWLRQKRGLTFVTAKRASLGLNGHIKIPIYDEDRNLVNVRTYDPEPVGSRRKIWSVKGRGMPHLYPISMLTTARPGDKVLFTEGEWDALIALQAGVVSVTRTAAARSTWRDEWTDWFAELRVYLCHDADSAGQEGNEIVARGIGGVCQELWQCHLPYPIRQKGGKDVSDLILDRGVQGVRRMMTTAERLV